MNEPTNRDSQSRGWFKAWRSDDALELLRANKNAFLLLYVIAYRAQWKQGFNRYNLQRGQALLGDHENYSLTAREYRTAKQNLQKWGFATFKTTSRGTVATLNGTSTFQFSAATATSKPTRGRRAGDKRPTISRQLPRLPRKKRRQKKGKNCRVNVGK